MCVQVNTFSNLLDKPLQVTTNSTKNKSLEILESKRLFYTVYSALSHGHITKPDERSKINFLNIMYFSYLRGPPPHPCAG
jgi:hypothetical protein